MLRLARRASSARTVGSLALLSVLAACASHGPRLNSMNDTAEYLAHARGRYVVPGPPGDPWGPYIRQAAARFDVPPKWIHAVMQAESGGHEYMDGHLTVSNAGAMGLMQVMPSTYNELRLRYHLGSDPFDPLNNIMAGTAYIREMYDIYGSPGFLAAYNAGPERVDDYLTDNRPLPNETRRYVAMIGPEIAGVNPDQRSPAENYAMNNLPVRIPPGVRYRHAVALTRRGDAGGGGRLPPPRPMQVAQLAEPPQSVPPAPTRFALVTPPPPPPSHGGFHFIQPAVAEPMPYRYTGVTGDWAIQVGAFSSPGEAHAAVGSARHKAASELARARSHVSIVRVGRAVLWRARLLGLSQGTAEEACHRLSHHGLACMVLSPEAQS